MGIIRKIIKMAIKLHEPKNLDEKITWDTARVFLSFGVEEMAQCIKRYLIPGEVALVDTHRQGINNPDAFDRIIEGLREYGINDGEYRFLKYPVSQKPEVLIKLYVVRK